MRRALSRYLRWHLQTAWSTVFFCLSLLSFSVDLQGQVAEFLGDLNGDSKTTVQDLVILQNHLNGAAALSPEATFFADLDQSGDVDDADFSLMLNVVMGRIPPPRTPLAGLAETSPQHGEAGVALTRETIVRLTLPLATDINVDDSVIRATFGGEPIPGQVHVSADRRAISLFYPEGLPATARVRVTISGDGLLDQRGLPFDINGDGRPGGERVIDFDTLSVTSFPSTAVCGRVFASDLATNENGSAFVNRPLAGVTIQVDGSDVSAVTDENGNFRLENAPAGRFFVHIDGRTVTDVGPAGAYYPVVGKAWESVPGVETNIGEIYLPLIPPETLEDASVTEETVLEFTPEFVNQNPKFNGVQVVVPANSLFSDDGSRGGMVGIAPVQPDRLPGEVSSDLPIQDVVTIQTDGATNFDVPAPICLPNLEDPLSGRRLSPGEKAALWSFNHDIGRFEIVGSMTVSEDGRLVCTDPGVGVLAPGWHGSSSGTQGDGGTLRTVRRSRNQQEKPGKEDPSGDPENQVRIPCPDNPNRFIVLYKNRRRPERNPEAAGGDPVYLHSGEFYEPVTDLRIVGREIDFIWSRKYRAVTGRPTAQGNNWDFSYNIFIRPEGENFVVCDGNSREDVYAPSGTGVWSAAGFFRTLEENFDGSYTLQFEHRGKWTFHPIDGRPEGGMVASIEERNGNRLTFSYDAFGRLATIVDSLDRPIEIRYTASGNISDVIDFAGRVIHYEYYGANDPKGNPGDLKSVTSPAVTDTPNGNDFPNGKTVSYTYTTGFEDERLNGNLTTITDGRRNDPNDLTFDAGPYLRNIYSEVSDPTDPNFDRIVRQVWGDPDDAIDYVYAPLLPSNANHRAVTKTIINDRRGLVKEYFYDEFNRLVVFREYTGFANPNEPTTELTNRPTGKVREEDPDFFQTVYEWNDEHLLTRTIMPNGTIQERVYECDVNPNADQKSKANLVLTRLLPGSHTPAGDQAVIEERYEYDTDFNGCCGFNFVTRYTDARGNVTTHDYDERGNRVRTAHRISSIVESFGYNEFGQLISQTLPDNEGVSRRDDYVYYAEGPQRGYLHRAIRDVNHFAYVTEMDYDLVGNIVSLTDPSGHTKEFVVNQLNQVVREVSREVTDGSGVRYVQDYFFDANNNVIRIDAPNVDHLGNPAINPVFTTRYDYEILNYLVSKQQEIAEGRVREIQYRYDRNRNRILTLYGEAVNGNQPNNNMAWEYNERDLAVRMIRGQNDPLQSTSEFVYDPNENMVVERHGTESENPRVIQRVFDGYDRPVLVTDPMGNETTYQYDANHNLIRHVKMGQQEDVPGGEGNVKMYAENAIYDKLNRLVRKETEFFEVSSGVPIDDGFATIAYGYNGSGLITSITDDNGNVSRRTYDTYYRPMVYEDGLGNSVQYEYDARSNLVKIIEVDRTDSGEGAETFVQEFIVDNVDRMTRHVDNLGHTMEFAHDSRNNLVRLSDAARDGTGEGNVTRFEYDGLLRRTAVIRELTTNGLGGGGVDGEIAVRIRYDDSDRVVARVDDNTNTTRYQYDPLNRLTAVQFADGTTEQKGFDVHSNVVRWVDANGSEIAAAYDQLRRVIRRDIQVGPGVADTTTFERFVYDGYSRMRLCQDDDDTIERAYTSTSRVIQERLNGVVSSAVFDGMDNLVECRYPTELVTTHAYDRVNRLTRIDDGLGLIVDPSYIGRFRVTDCQFGNGTTLVNEYDRDRRKTRIRQLSPQEGLFDDRRLEWDLMDNKTLHANEVTGQVEQFEYDSVYRLVSSQRTSGDSQSYAYDGVGNRSSVLGGANPGSYELSDTLGDPADLQMNQYTMTPAGFQRYDAKGNLLQSRDGGVVLGYDYRNQLVTRTDLVSGTEEQYQYDPMGRRTERRIVRRGDDDVTRYFYRGSQVLEAQNEAGQMLRQFVYGAYIDGVVNMRTDSENYFFHSDENYNVRKVTDRLGNVVERYEYDDFGTPTILSADGQELARSAIDNPYLFQGRRWDAETGLYYFRSRYLDPSMGRFISRDYLGTWGDPGNLGNAYAFAGNNPQTWLDPTGMTPKNGQRSPYDRAEPTGTVGHFHDRPIKGNDDLGSQAVEWITRGVSVLSYVVPDVLEPNLVVAHEHYFEGSYDESNPTEGHFGFAGGTREKLSDYNWQVSGEYSDDVMRMSRDMIDSIYYDENGSNDYDMLTNNCQHYTDSLREWYNDFLNALCSESGTGVSRGHDRRLRDMWVSRFGDVDVVILRD